MTFKRLVRGELVEMPQSYADANVLPDEVWNE